MKKNYLTIYYLLKQNGIKQFSAILILVLIFFSPSILSAQGKTIEINIADKQYQPPARTPKIPQEFKDKGARFVVRAGDIIKICNADKFFAKPFSLSKENKFQKIEGQGGLRPGSCITIDPKNPGTNPISFFLHDDIHPGNRLFLVVLPANWPDEGEENTPPAGGGIINDKTDKTTGTCTLAGTWVHITEGIGTTTWTITSDGKATETGKGYAKGTATLKGNTLRIDWKTDNGYSGYYEWPLDSNCNSDNGKLVFKSGTTGEHKSTVKKSQ